MSIKQDRFGRTPDGVDVDLFTLGNDKGATVKITTYGGRITELHVPDREGKSRSIVLGFDSLEQYLNRPTYFGCIVGRYANRIGKGRFTLDGTEVQVVKNEGDNTLHGGKRGFDKVIWQAEQVETAKETAIRLSYLSRNGEEGFPGNLHTHVTYTLGADNELRVDYLATTDQATVINLTNHSYFNLAGAGAGDVLGHTVLIQADRYTPSDEKLIPTGEIASVRNTPLDFTTQRGIGERAGELHNGYDHNLIFREPVAGVAARVSEKGSGRVMEMMTDQPAVQFYTSGHLNGTIAGVGGKYERFGGFCLETQHYPDSPNHPEFPSTVLRPGERFRSTTRYRFGTE